MYTQNIPMSISDTLKNKASEVWNLIDRDTGGTQTFSVPLSPNGQKNATAWGAMTILEQECYEALAGKLQQDGTRVPLTNAEFTAFLQARAAELGRPVPANAGSFRPQFKIGVEGQDFDSFLAENGLQRIRETVQGQGGPK